MSSLPAVRHNAAQHQFEATTDHGLATLRYIERGKVLDLAHTAVPQKAEGQGVGSALAHAALEHARRNHLEVVPSCPFVNAYLRSHAEFADLVAQR